MNTLKYVNSLTSINPWFDFTLDTKDFWVGFWERNEGFGAGKYDPDAYSQTMRDYHRLLWSRELPNGEHMKLEDGGKKFYLHWKDLWFGSDSITTTFRYAPNRDMIMKVKEHMPNYKEFVEDYLHKLYTIGGEMLFPSFSYCLNQARGCHPRIRDRWDLTLECIRLFYDDKENPLTKSLEKTRAYFELFVNFKNFVDFFFLQDCVDEKYNVKFWLETPLFESNPLPKTVEEYLQFVNAELDFVEKRNQRIAEYIKQF